MLGRYHLREPRAVDADDPPRPSRSAEDDAAAGAGRAGARCSTCARSTTRPTRARRSASACCRKADRRALILAYLGFPFYDVATLPLLQGEGLDEFDPIKVDRISPDDAIAIRKGGAAATLKGIQFNSFGAFFSRAYRENDYLWGRLHGADRLIDIVVSALPDGDASAAGLGRALKRDAFRAILDEEKAAADQRSPSCSSELRPGDRLTRSAALDAAATLRRKRR